MINDIKDIDEYIKEIINEGREEEYIIKLREKMNRSKELHKINKKYKKPQLNKKEGNLENESSDEIEEIDESKQKDNITIDINDN